MCAYDNVDSIAVYNIQYTYMYNVCRLYILVLYIIMHVAVDSVVVRIL